MTCKNKIICSCGREVHKVIPQRRSCNRRLCQRLVQDRQGTMDNVWQPYRNEKDCYGYERCVGMSLSYNFNTAKSKYKGTGAGNGEKSRL